MSNLTSVINRQIIINGQVVPYFLRVSARSRRHVRLVIGRGGQLIVTVPRRVSAKLVEEFIKQKSLWIFDKLAKIKKSSNTMPLSPTDIKQYREQAQQLIVSRIAHFNRHYNFSFGKITIRNQQTRWGSCSKKGNLNFNYHLALISPELADYVIVHELCHLGEFNHSKNFWALVAQTIPDYMERRRLLKQEGLRLL